MSEFAFPASIIRSGDKTSVVAFREGAVEPFHTADTSHPNWDDILEGLRKGDPNVWDLFDVANAVMRRFRQVTDRVSWDGHEVLWDGDPIHSVLSDQLSRALRENNAEVYTALAKFWEKLESNPEPHSREQAYDFLATHAFQITADGDVVGYKGVRDNGDGTYSSTARSQVAGKPSAFVNGQPVPPLSVVTQRVGDVVSMPRSEVTHDPAKSCERGLHVATHGYASGYGTVMVVTFNPRAIVSVPTIDRGVKVRVHEYTVVSIAGGAPTGDTVLRDESVPSAWAGDVGYKVH